MARYPVFIVGSPRSGTSALVDVMLAAGYSGFREGMFLSLLSGLSDLVSQHFNTFAADANDKILISRINADLLKKEIFGLLKKYMEAANPDGPWFDKTGNPEMIRAIPIIKLLWPESVFIFAKRRGIENVLSRLRKFPTHNFQYHCKDWAANMSAWREVRTQLHPDSFVEVDQQDMIQHPQAVAAELAGFLGLASGGPIEATLRLSRPQQSESNSAERVVTLDGLGWSQDQLTVFGKYCAAEMEAYGYAFDDQYRASTNAGDPKEFCTTD